MKTRITLITGFLLLGMQWGSLSCGVNTGNPTGKVKTSPTTDVPPSEEDGTTIVLSLSPLSSGTLNLSVNKVKLIPQGENLNSPKAVSFPYSEKTIFRSNQRATLASKQVIAAGAYDRIVLVLDGTLPATLLTADNQEKKIAIAPYQYYVAEGNESASDAVQIVVSTGGAPIQIGANDRQMLVFETDFSSQLKDFKAIDPRAYEYYKGLGQLDFEYSLDPLEVKSAAESTSLSNPQPTTEPLTTTPTTVPAATQGAPAQPATTQPAGTTPPAAAAKPAGGATSSTSSGSASGTQSASSGGSSSASTTKGATSNSTSTSDNTTTNTATSTAPVGSTATTNTTAKLRLVALDSILELQVDRSLLEISTICLYAKQQQAASLKDSSCAQAFAIAALAPGNSKAMANFSLPPGTYTIIARSEGRELLYTQTVSLRAGDRIKFSIPTASTLPRDGSFSVKNLLNFLLH